LFVFDGPHKPLFKRGKKIPSGAASLPDFLTKELLKRFGFPYHTAPGEAEAECALLQKEGLVDAVLSEDVDTLMFGCGVSLRNWTAEGARGNKSPTHVNVYNAEVTKVTAGFDSEGMILVALMSGGDYIPAGIPGCGPKIACEAAKAGFGRDLCSLAGGDVDGFSKWRKRLQMELQTNESKVFRQKHKAMTIPENFPDMTVLGYYVRPAVSSIEKVKRLKEEVTWDEGVKISELRLFVAEAFNWPFLIGAKKFIRGLAPALLAHQLVQRSMLSIGDEQSLEAKELSESRVIKAICGRRSHWNTDGTPELRTAYIPNDIVGIDLSAEENEDVETYGQDGFDNERSASDGEDARDRSRSPTKRCGPSTYDPTEVEKIWVLETYVKLGVPLLVETWEEDSRNPKKFASRKAREKKVLSKAKAGTAVGAMDQFVKTSKPGVHKPPASKDPVKQLLNTSLPPVFFAPATVGIPRSPQKETSSEGADPLMQKEEDTAITKVRTNRPKTREKPGPSQIPSSSPNDSPKNPWTLSKRPTDTLRFKSPTRYSALGIYAPGDPESYDEPRQPPGAQNEKPPTLASPPASPTPQKKRRSRPTTPISDAENDEQPSQPTMKNSSQTTPRKNTGLATPSTRNSAKPSPRKKRSPLEMANELYLAGQLKTPISNRKERDIDDLATGDIEQLTAKKVNRKIDFADSPNTTTRDSSMSDTSSLPSPSTLLSPPDSKPAKIMAGEPISPSDRRRASPCKQAKVRRFVALRESLEGAWKLLEPWEVEAWAARKGVFGGVEVLDLTGD